MTPTIPRRADRTQSTLDSLFLESRAAAPSPPPPPPPASMAAVPVLSVAFDKVDKQDDCHALWQVFSRCRDAIDDGARLENLSWRLWNRNLAGAKRGPCDGAAPPAAGAHFSLGVSDSELSGFTSDSSESPSSAGGSGADEAAITARSDCARRADVRPAPLSNSHPGPGSGAVRPVLEPRSRSSPDLHPGRFISELLPNRLVVPSAGRPSVPLPPPPSSPRSPLVQRPLLETVIMPSTPPSAAAGAGCPAVVVVNPTPHPTPPATPRVPDEVPHVPHVQTHIQPSVSSATLRVPASVLPTTHPAPGEHEADGRKAAPTMFFLCHEPNTPEHSPDSESSTMAPNLMAAAAAAAAATAVNAKPRDSALPPPLSRSISTSSRSLDEASVDMPGSATSSSFRPPSSIGSASRQRKGKEPVRHHVGTRAVGRPAFAHRVSHTKPTSRTVSPAKRQLQQPAPAPATQQPHQAPVTAPPPPAAVVPATGASNKPRADPVMPNPAVAPVAAPPAAREPTLAPTTRPISPQAARVSLFKTLLAPANRRVELATSSEFDSDSADDSSWASEDDSAGDGVERGPDIAREAALEAQRQREMFAKLPTRSYSNLDQLPQTGLLTSMFHPERVAQASSTRDVLAAAARTTSAPSLQMVGRSPVAAPLIQQVTAQPTLSNTQYRTGYRPRGRPEDEPEDTDTDEDDPEDTVQVSQSVAQRRLAALAGRHLQQQQRSQQPTQQQQQQQSPEQQPFQPQQPLPQAGPSALPNGVAVAPIPFSHAHLPVPLPPQTPRTTRRNMLASEMSESLRRNLLWERQVTKRSHGLPRNTSAGSRLQPLTSLAGANEPIDEREARRRAAIARNRSWADDFHTSGW